MIGNHQSIFSIDTIYTHKLGVRIHVTRIFLLTLILGD